MIVQEVRFTDLNEVSIVEVDEDLNPGPLELVVAPLRIGICGSDLHVLHGKHPFVKPPVVTGHEMVGEVVAAGSACDHLIGEHVLVNPLVVPDNGSRAGWRGTANYQEDAKVMGFRLQGLARTLCLVPVGQAHVVPKNLNPSAAVIAEPLAAALHAARRAAGRLDDVLIIGGGPIGLCVLLAAKSQGAGRITVVEPIESKRILAKSLGAEFVFAPDDRDFKPAGFGASFDCVASPGTLSTALAATVGGGAVVVVGVPGQNVEIPLARMQRFEIDLFGSGMYTAEDINDAIRLIADGTIDVTPLISGSFPLTSAADAYRAAADPESVKTLLEL